MTPDKPRGRAWFILGIILAAALGLALGGFVGLPSMVERAALRAVRRLEARFGVEVAAGRVDWTWGGDVRVTDLRVASGGEVFLRAPAVSIELDVAPWERHVRAVAIHVDHPTITLRRDASGATNVDRVLAGLKSGAAGAPGGGMGVTIDPTPPAIAMEGATVEVAATLPTLPFGLTIPDRVALRDGTITVVAAEGSTAEAPRFEASARFADTTLDPGFGVELGATVSKARGPERLAVHLSRPVRFMLGRRVVGFGGLAWSPSEGSFEVSSLQLSVPMAPSDASGVVAAAATCEKLTLAPEPLSLLKRIEGAPTLAKVLRAVDAIEVTKPVLKLDVDAEGRHSFEDLLPRGELGDVAGEDPLGPGRPKTGMGATASLSRVAVDASLAASDRLLLATGAATGDSLAARFAAKFEALARRSERWVPRAAAALDKLSMKRVEVHGGELLLDFADASLDLVGVEVKATMDGGKKRVEGRFDASDGMRVGLAAELAPGTGDLAIDAHVERLPLARVPTPVLDALHLGRDGQVTLADVKVRGPASGARWEVTGDVAVDDLVFAHPSVARDPLRDLDLGWKGTVVFDAEAGRLTVSDSRLRSKDVAATLDVDVASGRTTPKLHAALDLPETSAQSFFDAIPKAMVPLLEGLRVEGTLRWPVSIDLDLGKPGDIQVRSEPVLTGFALLSLGQHVDFNELRGTHSYKIRLGDGTPGERLVGPYTGSWVPLESISPFLAAALTTTEDGTFYTNDGVSTSAMKESLATNLSRGSFVRGASTITQQLVKNLYLGGEKTLSRKVQELFIAWQMTKALSKGEIMALYLNAIEFAPGIYGIGDAAWYYFGKRASELTLTEAIFLASIVPGPRRYHYFFEEGKVTDRWRAYLVSLLKIMVERGKITQEDFDGAAPYDVVFRGSAAPVDGDDKPPPDFDAPPDDDRRPGDDPE